MCVNRTYSISPSLLVKFFLSGLRRWNTSDAKIKASLVEHSELSHVSSVELAVSHNKASRAPPAARNSAFVISVYGSFKFVFLLPCSQVKSDLYIEL